MRLRIAGCIVLAVGLIVSSGCGDTSSGSGGLEQDYQDSHASDCDQARQMAYNELRQRGYSEEDSQIALDGVMAASGC